MSGGLIALLDDVGALAKAAAASFDDIAAHTAKAGLKVSGVVIDDTAVTPNYVVGLSPSRELPIIGKIALGSIKSKLLFLWPAALLLSAVAPWAITPLLMVGGAYLCLEGAEKVWHVVYPSSAHSVELPKDGDSQSEHARVRSAIQTDFILSAEIMAVALGSVGGLPIWKQALVLLIVALSLTGLVYGVVALIVKADDAGLWLAKRSDVMSRVVGRTLLVAMPVLLKLLSYVGTAAMIWVGGGIVLHGLSKFDIHQPADWVESAARAARQMAPQAAGLLGWAADAAGSAIFGLLLGGVLIPVIELAVSPALRQLRTLSKRSF